MDCIFEEYIKYIDNFLVNYFKLLLGSKYEKGLVRPFIDKYIDVRYYNKYVIKEDNFTERLNKELNTIAKEVMQENEEKIEKIKNIFALFSYVLFIDGCTHFSNLNALLKSLFNDKNITLSYEENTKKELNTLIREFINKKVAFFKLFKSDEFFLKGKRYNDNVLIVSLGQSCNMSKLYSEYAIKKAYESDVVFENRTYVTLLMVSSKILSDIIALDFSKNYIVDFPVTLLDKPKKIIKYLKALDDELLRTKIHLKFKYKDYRKFKKEIRNLISQDYSICLELDETYDVNFDDLVLFSYLVLDKKYSYYDNIIKYKDDIKPNIITL